MAISRALERTYPLRLRQIGEKDGKEIWLVITELGNYGIEHGGYTIASNMEDAVAYGDYLLGKGPYPFHD